LKGTGVVVVPNKGYNPLNQVTLKFGDKKITVSANNDAQDAETEMNNLRQWLEGTLTADQKGSFLSKGASGVGSKY